MGSIVHAKPSQSQLLMQRLTKKITNMKSVAARVSSVKRLAQENAPAINEHTFKIQLKALKWDFVTAN